MARTLGKASYFPSLFFRFAFPFLRIKANSRYISQNIVMVPFVLRPDLGQRNKCGKTGVNPVFNGNKTNKQIPSGKKHLIIVLRFSRSNRTNKARIFASHLITFSNLFSFPFCFLCFLGEERKGKRETKLEIYISYLCMG